MVFLSNQKFRDYFSAVTGISPFKFSANMATAWRKVKRDKDISFTIQDMLKYIMVNQIMQNMITQLVNGISF